MKKFLIGMLLTFCGLPAWSQKGPTADESQALQVMARAEEVVSALCRADRDGRSDAISRPTYEHREVART